MKIVRFISFVCVAGMLFCCGCEPETTQGTGTVRGSGAAKKVARSTSEYSPAEVHISPLSGFDGAEKLSVYVELQDEFETHIKRPGIFRFEIYEYIPRSIQSKGRRVHIWDDFDLTAASKNNEYWRDFLRTYLFDLDVPFEPAAQNGYVLEVNFLSENYIRLIDSTVLKQD